MERPSWAVEHARAALKIGMKVADIEQQLVAKGLSPAEANDVVMSIVEGHFHDDTPAPLEAEGQPFLVQLILSVVVASVCLGLVYWLGGTRPMAWTLVSILPGLVCIWIATLLDWTTGAALETYYAFGWAWLLLVGGGRVVIVVIYSQLL